MVLHLIQSEELQHIREDHEKKNRARPTKLGNILFVPIGMAEDLTKVQLILCNEIKTEIQEVKNTITSFQFEEMQRNFSEIATMLDERMTNLEEEYSELKKLVKQGTTQNYIANPALLEHWNPGDMVIKHNPWTTMRLVLNKVASENITDLFPSDWHPRPIMSIEHDKQYKVMTELMTHMFQQCGYLPEENIIEMDNYQTFSEHCNTMCIWLMYQLLSLFIS